MDDYQTETNPEPSLRGPLLVAAGGAVGIPVVMTVAALAGVFPPAFIGLGAVFGLLWLITAGIPVARRLRDRMR